MASALSLNLPLSSSSEELARLKLVKAGVALLDDDSVRLLKEGGKQKNIVANIILIETQKHIF